MCSFIGLRIGKPKEDVTEEDFIEKLHRVVEFNLLDKGGDYTNITMFAGGKPKVFTNVNFEDEDHIKELINGYMQLSAGDIILGFSRLTPETENVDPSRFSSIPPFETIFGKYVAAHGTIPMNHIDIDMIDTEILKFDESITDSIKKIELLNGKTSLMEYDPKTNTLYGIHNGLGLSSIEYIDWFYGITNTIYDTETRRNSIKDYGKTIYKLKVQDINPDDIINVTGIGVISTQSSEPKKEVIISLCSGGMDAMFSTTSYLLKSKPENISAIHICYFDWGTRAGSRELEATDKYINYIRDYSNYRKGKWFIYFDKLDTEDFFNEIHNFAGKKSRLSDPDAVGEGEKEAESAISYVPLRNTFMLLALAAKFEAKYPNQKVTFIFGGNLTEGMVYSDNSVNYISKMNQLIKVAGQKTSNFQVVAPFAKMTKTKMLESFKDEYPKILAEIMNMSFSCYFPESSKPCGKCGSCLLRDSAIKRAGLTVKDGMVLTPIKISLDDNILVLNQPDESKSTSNEYTNTETQGDK